MCGVDIIMRSRPYYDTLPTFRGETEQRRHGKNGGSRCAVAECRCRHDTMTHVVVDFMSKIRRLP